MNGRRAWGALSCVPEATDDVDRASMVGRGVKVSRGKDLSRIAEDGESSAAVMNDDIVVDAEVVVIGVLVLAADLDVRLT